MMIGYDCKLEVSQEDTLELSMAKINEHYVAYLYDRWL